MASGRYCALSATAVILLCIAAAGCLEGKTTPVSTPGAPAVFVDYHRTGGIAGFDDRLVIFDNGAAVVATRSVSREIVLNVTELVRIRSLFEQVQFSQLQENYPAPRGSADLFTYSISYSGRTVTLEESAYPQSVQPLIDALNQIIRNAGTPDLLGMNIAP